VISAADAKQEGTSMIKPDLNLSSIKDFIDKDQLQPKLSPTPRKSERDRKNISYDKLNKGAVDSEDENQGQDALGKPKKPDGKKCNVAEVNKKMSELIESMKKHEAANLFNQPLDTNHSMYSDIKDKYTTLSMLDLHFKIGDQFKNTDDIATEFRKMIMIKLKMSMHGGDPTEYPLIQSFNNQFDKEFSGLDG
jgi:hypothetical protein